MSKEQTEATFILLGLAAGMARISMGIEELVVDGLEMKPE